MRQGAVLGIRVDLIDDHVWRWVLSAATVSRAAGSAVVKKTWKRCSSNSVP